MPADPSVLRRKGKFDRLFFDGMADSGANVIRLPAHPERWELDPDYLWRYIDPAVQWNGENGVYVIIDLQQRSWNWGGIIYWAVREGRDRSAGRPCLNQSGE